MPKEISNKPTDNPFESKQNLTGFFHKLLEIDMRINPHLYEDMDDLENPKC